VSDSSGTETNLDVSDSSGTETNLDVSDSSGTKTNLDVSDSSGTESTYTLPCGDVVLAKPRYENVSAEVRALYLKHGGDYEHPYVRERILWAPPHPLYDSPDFITFWEAMTYEQFLAIPDSERRVFFEHHKFGIDWKAAFEKCERAEKENALAKLREKEAELAKKGIYIYSASDVLGRKTVDQKPIVNQKQDLPVSPTVYKKGDPGVVYPPKMPDYVGKAQDEAFFQEMSKLTYRERELIFEQDTTGRKKYVYYYHADIFLFGYSTSKPWPLGDKGPIK